MLIGIPAPEKCFSDDPGHGETCQGETICYSVSVCRGASSKTERVLQKYVQDRKGGEKVSPNIFVNGKYFVQQRRSGGRKKAKYGL